FLCGTGGFYGHGVGGHIDDVGAEQFDSLDYRCAGGCIGANLDQDVVALGGLLWVKFNDFDDVDQFIELFGDLFESVALRFDDHRHPGQALDLRWADSQRFNVECTAGEQSGDTAQDTGDVLD